MISLATGAAITHLVGVRRRRFKPHRRTAVDGDQVQHVGKEGHISHTVSLKNPLDIIIHPIADYIQVEPSGSARSGKIDERRIDLLPIEESVQFGKIDITACGALPTET